MGAGRAGLTDAAPFLAGCGGDVDFGLGRVFEAHDRVGVEVALLDPAVLTVISPNSAADSVDHAAFEAASRRRAG